MTAKDKFYERLSDKLDNAVKEGKDIALTDCIKSVIQESPHFYGAFAAQWLAITDKNLKNFINCK